MSEGIYPTTALVFGFSSATLEEATGLHIWTRAMLEEATGLHTLIYKDRTAKV